jgi:hypothetical protein
MLISLSFSSRFNDISPYTEVRSIGKEARTPRHVTATRYKEARMPYILAPRRETFDPHLRELAALVENGGDMNYCIYKLSCLLIEKMGESYANYSMCGSAMEHAKLEWYRRRVAPYEDRKINENGDI